MRNEKPLLNHLPYRGGSHSSCTVTKAPLSLSPFTAVSLTRLFSPDRSAAIEHGILGTGLLAPAAEGKQEARLINVVCSSPSGLCAASNRRTSRVIEIQSHSEDSRLSDRVYRFPPLKWRCSASGITPLDLPCQISYDLNFLYLPFAHWLEQAVRDF